MEKRSFTFLDFWDVEGAMEDQSCENIFTENSPLNGPSFSCFEKSKDSPSGPVGEAALQVFINTLSQYDTPVDW